MNEFLTEISNPPKGSSFVESLYLIDVFIWNKFLNVGASKLNSISSFNLKSSI